MTNKKPLEKNLCCHVLLLGKIVYPDETDRKCYILQKYLCHACYRDKVYTWHILDIEGFITIGDNYNHRFGMLGAIYGSEITMT